MFKILWSGRKQAQTNMELAPLKFSRRLKQNMVTASALVEAQMKKEMFGSRTRARRFGRVPTAPPQVLAIDSGKLRQSISFDVTSLSGRITAEIGPQRVPYARIHELGGFAGRAFIPKRPYIVPALEKTESEVTELLGRTFDVVTF